MKTCLATSILITAMMFSLLGCNSNEQSGDSALLSSAKSGVVAAEDFDIANAPEDAVCKAAIDATECVQLGCEPIFDDPEISSEDVYLSCLPKHLENEVSQLALEADLERNDCSDINSKYKDQNNEGKVIICQSNVSGKKISHSINCHALPAYIKSQDHSASKFSFGPCTEDQKKR